MPARFNPAPGWPPAPEGWTPEPGWAPDPSWPPAPPGWQLWVDDATEPGDAPAEAPHAPFTAPDPVLPPAGPIGERPWYKKKRFLLPIGTVVVFGVLGSLGGGDEPAMEAAAPTPTASAVQAPTPEGPSAEEVAAEAEAARLAAEQKAAEEAAEAEAERVAAEEAAAAAAAAEAAKGTMSQQNAYASAERYLNFKAFSRNGLLDQLTSEYGDGFPAEDAEFAVARLEAAGLVDWNEQAAKSAKSYLEHMPFSRQGLLDQLTSEYGEHFTPEQAAYGVSQTGL